jgi:beta-xylosidase
VFAAFCALGTTGGIGAALTASPVAAQDTDPASPGERAPTRGPLDDDSTTEAVEHLDLVGGLLLDEPIVDGDFADPYALSEPDAVYIYATNTVHANIPVLELPKGQDVDARYLGDALPKLPSWTVKGFQWAPAVWARPDGRFVMYYVTPSSDAPDNRGCISRATSDDPAGPFVDDSTEAFICPLSQGGAIDPSVVVDDDGTPHLLWKSDGNCCKLPTIIYSQRLSSDGLSTAGEPVELLTATQPWEGDLIEAPSMVRKGSTHYLFYSANNWDSTNYAVGAAVCESITGPCHKPERTPWMASSGRSRGPGGEEFFAPPGSSEIWMVHHGWLPHQAGTPDGQRRLYLDRISFGDGDALPTRSNDEAVAEALVEDAAFLALLAGAVVGAVVLVGGALARRRRQDTAAG